MLLIKAARGGHRLSVEFRSPRSGPPPVDLVEDFLRDLRKTRPDEAAALCGSQYREMLEEVRGTLDRLSEEFPGYRGQGAEVAGFVWFSGWNDMVQPRYNFGYSAHLANLIRDVRDDLGVPGLPFVIGQMGVGGEPNQIKKDFRGQQAAVADLPEFAGNVALVATDPFWDREAEAVFNKGWKDHLDEWNRIGSDYPFHYLGSAQTTVRIGRAFGDAMIGLIETAPGRRVAAGRRFTIIHNMFRIGLFQIVAWLAARHPPGGASPPRGRTP